MFRTDGRIWTFAKKIKKNFLTMSSELSLIFLGIKVFKLSLKHLKLAGFSFFQTYCLLKDRIWYFIPWCALRHIHTSIYISGIWIIDLKTLLNSETGRWAKMISTKNYPEIHFFQKKKLGWTWGLDFVPLLDPIFWSNSGLLTKKSL